MDKATGSSSLEGGAKFICKPFIVLGYQRIEEKEIE